MEDPTPLQQGVATVSIATAYARPRCIAWSCCLIMALAGEGGGGARGLGWGRSRGKDRGGRRNRRVWVVSRGRGEGLF